MSRSSLPQRPNLDANPTANDPSDVSLTEQEQFEFSDEAIQAKYRAAFLEQLRRRACPGCGEGEVLG